MPAVAATAGLPSRLGKYELLLPLAAGGMARIYIGRSTGIGSFERHVVLKLITPERANDHTAVQMFLDEARLAASLNHQNVAQVFEVGEDLGIHYLAMEYVHGQDLRAVLAKAGSAGTRIPLELALTVVAGAAAGLNHAHDRRGPDGVPLGIVHRDVSPSNIMIGYDGSVKLLDFGIAKATHRSVETQSGIIKGKFAYMAPEQCRGRDVDKRSDVFSLGIILYEITTQHRCFRADSDFDTMHRIVTGDVVRPTRLVQNYPQALEAIVMKALAIDAAQRYQSAGLLLEALESFAVSSRMSLSTMGLGRFMRDMFGEVQEPWLTSRGSQPVIPKETTVSSTDGQGQTPVPIARHPEPIPDAEARFPDSAGVQAAKTVLDLPRRPHDQPEEAPVEWNAKSYPQMQPSLASSDTLPPEAMGRPGYGQATPSHGLAQPPSPGQFQGSQGSGSGPAHPAMGIVSTKHGYASGGAMSRGDAAYPRYEPVPDATGDLVIRSNKRPLIIGGTIAAIGIIVLLAIAFGGSGPRDPNDNSVNPPQPAASPGSDVTAAKPEVVAPAPPPPAPVEDMISIHVGSEPKGADVLIAGTKIGVTPLDKQLKRGSKLAQLTIHLAGYVDVTSKIDLGGDLSKDVTLHTVDAPVAPAKPDEPKVTEQPDEPKPTEPPDEPKPVEHKPAAVEHKPATTEHKPVTTEHKPATTEHKPATTTTEHKPATTEHKHEPPPPPKPKCQPPGPNVDPFNGVPVCKG